ncbi:unnamed protein product [Bursaphelenchus okinawaensis]|uniref:glutathione-specific gamma-glutamylcyclotransferase n=1 Tax=Bursaphelenchus okinawaensis TaxID=465554 RepID=A0A811LDG9_9BILA|nr:unnamed protein product [Bursaphelenchus okinawaensis]CAG9120448.1 unnamed protein product [Bursaphelenchus okinawaensis]
MAEVSSIGPKRPRMEERRPPLDCSHRLLNQSLDIFHLLIGVTGSVATIKLEELIADLRKKFDESKLVIKVVTTSAALNFFDPNKLESEGVIVYEDSDEWNMFKKRGDPVLHIDLRKWADAFIIAPLDANSLAKICHGLCDNLLTCVARAWDFNKPFFFAPAMNTCMWEHPVTAEQVKKLIVVFGCKEIPPMEKELMCGDKGYGAMAKIPMISSVITTTEMWVFGYGSLLWYTDFPYEAVIPGVVQGYVRRFWQMSPDHRGTETKPGRTVTLVPQDGGMCWGLAYKVPEEHIENTIAYLNFRERAGYKREVVEFHPDNGEEPFELSVYISYHHEDNIYHTGPVTNDEIVDVILSSKGRTGTNLEYALRLADIHRRLAPHIHDPHLFDIERRLLKACESKRIRDKILNILGHNLPHLKSA